MFTENHIVETYAGHRNDSKVCLVQVDEMKKAIIPYNNSLTINIFDLLNNSNF